MATEVKAAGTDNTYRSDHLKTNDRTGMADGGAGGSIAKRDIADKASDMADGVAHKAKQAGDTFMDKASDVGHSMQETGHNIVEKTKHTHQVICNFTKDNPTAAVLMAFGLGAILARILPGR